MLKALYLFAYFSLISADNQPHIIFILADDLVIYYSILFDNCMHDCYNKTSIYFHNQLFDSRMCQILHFSWFFDRTKGVEWSQLSWLSTNSNTKFRCSSIFWGNAAKLLCYSSLHPFKKCLYDRKTSYSYRFITSFSNSCVNLLVSTQLLFTFRYATWCSLWLFSLGTSIKWDHATKLFEFTWL